MLWTKSRKVRDQSAVWEEETVKANCRWSGQASLMTEI